MGSLLLANLAAPRPAAPPSTRSITGFFAPTSEEAADYRRVLTDGGWLCGWLGVPPGWAAAGLWRCVQKRQLSELLLVAC